MAAYIDITPGDEIYRLAEKVIDVERLTAPNLYGPGQHHTGQLRIVTERKVGTDTVTTMFEVGAGELVHTDDAPGCYG